MVTDLEFKQEQLKCEPLSSFQIVERENLDDLASLDLHGAPESPRKHVQESPGLSKSQPIHRHQPPSPSRPTQFPSPGHTNPAQPCYQGSSMQESSGNFGSM